LRYDKSVVLSSLIKERALAIGFDLVGVAPVTAGQDLEFSKQWVDRGFGGEMEYLKNPKREDPRRVLPSARSVICAGLIYNTPHPYSTEACRGANAGTGGAQLHPAPASGAAASAKPDPPGGPFSRDDIPRAWISRYAWGHDYHEVMRAKLEKLRAAIEALAPQVETRVYVDTGPVVERALARYSGIGWMGKNTCLINEDKGSWFFLGVVLTSLELRPDMPAPDRCGTCTRCLEACPTGALVEPYVMDASRCIAYFTIELKGSIPREFRPAVGSNLFGCDICQDVCPWNSRSSGQLPVASGQLRVASSQRRSVAVTSLAEFQPLEVRVSAASHSTPSPPAPLPQGEGGRRPGEGSVQSPTRSFSLFNPPLEALASFTAEDFGRAFARSPIKRAKYRGWLRNLCVAIGNSGDRRFVPWLEKAARHPDPVIREHAEWALERIAREEQKEGDGAPRRVAS